MIHKDSLAQRFPDIAKEWDYDMNGNLRPEDITYGSHLSVYWICPICHNSYKKRICNRTAPSKINHESRKCPICLGRIIVPGFNSLKAKFPDIVAKEWDYDKNKVDPDTIPPHRNKPKYWWKCSHGHSYQASANNKTSQTGGNCPYCSHQKLSIENSLAKCNPELAKEWCKDKNKLSPEQVFANSNQYAWWRCEKGHIWEAKIDNRNNGEGCPECSKGSHTSFPEQVIFYYIKKLFPDSINGYKHKGKEIDIFIPSLNIGIEYDGEFYHKTEKKLKKDLLKNKLLKEDGILLIRIRESNCPEINDNSCIVYTYKYTSNYTELEDVLKSVLNFICAKACKINNLHICLSDIKNELHNKSAKVPIQDSLATQNISLSKDWDYKENYPLTPELVTPNSSNKASWICHVCGYKWEATIGSRNKGCGCPSCSKTERYTTSEWIRKAKTVHKENYDYSLVNYVNSKTPITIICPTHGPYTQLPSEHLSGKGCPYCANQAFHPLNSLANLYPKIAAEWDYELNKDTGFNPENIGIDSRRKFYWHCNYGKNHSYQATISYRVNRNSGCAICHGKQVDYSTSVAYLRPDLAKEWCDNNKYKPTEVSLGSEKKILWKCKNKDHQAYYASVYSRVHLGSGCPECAGNIKTHIVFSKEIHEKFPNIELISKYQKSSIRIKCICKICGYEWTPFPNNLLKGKGCPECYKSKKQTKSNGLKGDSTTV